jgi:uncharacterized protein YyaL (SSP411 family)
MIKGMARAGRLLERDDWLDSAAAALSYLQEVHFDGEGLRATSRDGRARLTGYLDDYAYLLDAVLELLQARWRSEWLDFALVIGATWSSISKTRKPAASSSRRTIMKPWSTGPSRWATTRCRAATRSP